jgi:DSF synthase
MNSLALFDQSVFPVPGSEKNRQLNTHFDARYKISWCHMNAFPRPCFTPPLLAEFKRYTETIKKEMNDTNGQKYDYIVVASDVDGIFNYGGDLSLFKNSIQSGDRAGLLSYATECIDVLYENMTHLQQDLTTISLVQGDALGGGFEAALASNILIAEKGAKMGFPEVLFNLFPGMGAFSFLSRKIGSSQAEKIILSGKLYSSDELFELGIVDVLAEKGEGELAVYNYIKASSRQSNSYQAMRKVKDICNPISYQELLDIVKVWVDAAFNLSPRDLKMMDRLIQRQNSVVKKPVHI